MKRRNKLLALSLVIGLNVQSMQVYANSGSHNITSHRIRKLKKRVMPYTLHKNRHPADMIISTDETAFQSGIASWYGGRHTQRRKTASGSTFNNQNFTAAHPTLPLGSKVLVKSEDTGHSVIVTINDRGPFVKHRIIDLSKAAAAKIGMLSRGTAHVTIKPLNNIEVAETPQ